MVGSSQAPYPVHPLLRVLARVRADKGIPERFFRDTCRVSFYNWLWGRFRPRLHTVAEVASLLGCDLALVERDTGRVWQPTGEDWARYRREVERHDDGKLTLADLG